MLCRAFWALALSASAGLATITNTLSVTTATTVKCSTTLGTAKVKSVPTSSTTSRLPPQVVILITTSHPVATVTPAPVTTTTTSTVTNTATVMASQVTDTFSTTTTFYSTAMTTSTETDTVTETDSTTISTTSTSTVQLTAALTPVSDTVTASAAPQKRQVDSGKLPHRANRKSVPDVKRAASKKPSGPGLSSCKNAGAVKCVGYVQVHYTKEIILVGKTRTTTLGAATTTATVTATATTTSTVLQMDASTTVTSSVTSTTTSTATTTTTVTTTTTTTNTATATATFYAACANNNIIGPMGPNGGYLGDVYRTNSGSYQSASAGSAYDCCVACATTSTCGYSVFYGGSSCVLAVSSTCSASTMQGTVYETNAANEYNPLYLSNGYCGYVADGGINDSLGA